MKNYISETEKSNIFLKENGEFDIVNCVVVPGQDANLILRRRAMLLGLWNLPASEHVTEKNDTGWKRMYEEIIEEKFWKNIPVSLSSICWDSFTPSVMIAPIQ